MKIKKKVNTQVIELGNEFLIDKNFSHDLTVPCCGEKITFSLSTFLNETLTKCTNCSQRLIKSIPIKKVIFTVKIEKI